MADFNQKKPGEGLTNSSDKFRKQNLVKNTYPSSDTEGYSPNHPNALSDGDEKGKGNAIYLGVYGNDIGTRTDIMGNGEANTGRMNNLKTNLYGQNNEYGAGNIDSGDGYTPKQ
tara:strand:+ start:261 stop:602 length:342 start_codon:yes stop_codon:yes gene_type:complete